MNYYQANTTPTNGSGDCPFFNPCQRGDQMELNETELLQILKKQCFTPEDVAYFSHRLRKK
jgi:hypothetical protein